MAKQTLVLWHPDSPGMRVRVTRGFFGRLFRSKEFASLSEVIKHNNQLLEQQAHERLRQRHYKAGFSDALGEYFSGRTIEAAQALIVEFADVPETSSSTYYNAGVRCALRLIERVGFSQEAVEDFIAQDKESIGKRWFV